MEGEDESQYNGQIFRPFMFPWPEHRQPKQEQYCTKAEAQPPGQGGHDNSDTVKMADGNGQGGKAKQAEKLTHRKEYRVSFAFHSAVLLIVQNTYLNKTYHIFPDSTIFVKANNVS